MESEGPDWQMRWLTESVLVAGAVGALTIGTGACSPGASTGSEPAPGAPAVADGKAGSTGEPGRPAVSPMLVLRESGGLARGDTLNVDTTSAATDLQVGYYGGGVRRGTVSLERLGIVGRGMMIVSAERARVRRCRSKGCSVIGYVVMGQPVEVYDYRDGWYRFLGSEGVEGYIFGEYLQLPLIQRRRLLARIRARTAAYFDRELKTLGVAGRGAGEVAVFEGWELRSKDGLLSFEFYTPFGGGEGVVQACNAMRGITAFVNGLMSEFRSDLFPAYSAGVYYDAPDTEARDDVMVAGLAGDGSTYCKGP